MGDCQTRKTSLADFSDDEPRFSLWAKSPTETDIMILPDSLVDFENQRMSYLSDLSINASCSYLPTETDSANISALSPLDSPATGWDDSWIETDYPTEKESSAAVPAAAPDQELIADQVYCLSCRQTYRMEFIPETKKEEMCRFIKDNEQDVGTEMSAQNLTTCRRCRQKWVKMIDICGDTPHQHINWHFLFLAKLISVTAVSQMKGFMRSRGPFKDPKDRNKLIFQVYQKINEQLYGQNSSGGR